MDFQGILTTTAQSLSPYVVDSIHNGSVIPARFLTKPVDWDQGRYYVQPIQSTQTAAANGGAFVGMPTFAPTAENNDVNLQFEAKGERQSIVLPWVELAHNTTKAGVIKLMGRKMDIAKNSMKDRLGGRLATSVGTGDEINGLNLLTDDSTLTTTYGGLSRATHGAVINGNRRNIAAATNFTLSDLGSQFDACTPANTDEGTTLALTTKTVWGFVEKILDPKSRQMYSNVPTYVSAYTQNGGAVTSAELGGASGFSAIFHRGIPVVKDEKVPSGVLYSLNEAHIDFARLPIPQMKTVTLSNTETKGVYDGEPAPTAFQITELMQPTNQLGEIGHMVVYGQFFNRNPKRGGLVTNITQA